ncbi:MAG: acyl-CoA ligase (AMP-forming), exosortase A system-associated [Azonexus sp.]|nr:acyl-CoA ligase (AMP-forming), exosortase A system-associated [Betaproteobacteria bacterium]MBK8918977.1 acyl-CoA ligase (AMP-forming), exosortase A system-associated [Betaproteobacteria bacterium]MBP6035792.1 acyl-CoA ligase (AMP-forming), exosortase A system-associated [Azonexus sp.]MBP6905429.1 acyl-CoA ligase (AMP-forming), exosortase A system-associated [Azonexus sp.]
MNTFLLHHLPLASAAGTPAAPALTYTGKTLSYGELAGEIESLAGGLVHLGLGRGERVGIYLEKRFEFVVAAFGAAAAGGVFVPLNPLLKAEQVGYILADCAVRILITSAERFEVLRETLAACHDLRRVIVIGELPAEREHLPFALESWSETLAGPRGEPHRVIDTDVVSILYTSGSTGRPKGVVLSHRNMVAGAKSVASYLENRADDTLLAALPLSFDAGFSQLTTAFHVGARVVLLNYLLPKDVLNAIAREKVTGLTAVPPLYIQLTQLKWPETVTDHLRYFANTGGRMPRETLDALRRALPRSKPYLMYGLTEAFRSTYLPPEQVDRRPDSIGKAIPNAEILVLREDGSECAPNEPGELVHRGALVGQGYWNDGEKTAERYKPLLHREAGLVLPEIAVFSGDTVRRDEEGYLYFIGRRDEMIKTSGYRVSPTEIEEVLYGTQLVGEVAAFGVPHPQLGQAVVVVATPRGETLDVDALLKLARERLPIYMLPARVDVRPGPLPRNPNGKIDRKLLSGEFQNLYE